jgi:hypothetical protein
MLNFALFSRYDQIEKYLVVGQHGSYGTLEMGNYKENMLES